VQGCVETFTIVGRRRRIRRQETTATTRTRRDQGNGGTGRFACFLCAVGTPSTGLLQQLQAIAPPVSGHAIPFSSDNRSNVATMTTIDPAATSPPSARPPPSTTPRSLSRNTTTPAGEEEGGKKRPTSPRITAVPRSSSNKGSLKSTTSVTCPDAPRTSAPRCPRRTKAVTDLHDVGAQRAWPLMHNHHRRLRARFLDPEHICAPGLGLHGCRTSSITADAFAMPTVLNPSL
jgi:hypothetical protein